MRSRFLKRESPTKTQRHQNEKLTKYKIHMTDLYFVALSLINGQNHTKLKNTQAKEMKTELETQSYNSRQQQPLYNNSESNKIN